AGEFPRLTSDPTFADLGSALPPVPSQAPQAATYPLPGGGSVSGDRVFAANGDYLGPPGGLWGDWQSAARNGLGIVGPNGEKARDSSEFWLNFPWVTLQVVEAVPLIAGVVRGALALAARAGVKEGGALATRGAATTARKAFQYVCFA